IRTRIYDGTLEPGTRLVEREIAEEFDVSRLPVREALRILQNEGLVESLPTRGMIVCELSLRLVSELFDVREALESLAARQAAHRVSLGATPLLDVTMAEVNDAVERGDKEAAHTANSRFHDEIIQLSGNNLLAHTLSPLVGRLSCSDGRSKISISFIANTKRLRMRSLQESRNEPKKRPART